MNEKTNPFKALESDACCPTDLKDDLIAEIDLIRNALMVDTYLHNTGTVLTIFTNGLLPTNRSRAFLPYFFVA